MGTRIRKQRSGAPSVLASAIGFAWTLGVACTLQAPPEHAADGGSGGSSGAAASSGATSSGATSSGATSSGTNAGATSTSKGGRNGLGGSSVVDSSSAGNDAVAGDANAGGDSASGACSPACGGASVCQGGVCRCDGTLAYCAGECVNTKSDPDHCGSGCGVRCTGGQACVAGACTCESGSFCGDACVDTSVDRANCGGCDKPCGNPRTCSAGKCECASGLTFCSPGCVDAKTDQLNCGTCGMQCQGASQCVNGACKVCSTGCAVLSTTVADNSSNPWVTYGTKLNPPVDLVEANVTAVVYVATSVKPTFIEIHCDDTTDSSSSGTYVSMPIPATGWYKITAGQLTLAHVDLLELMLTNFDGVGTATVYVDSITISSGVAGPWDFTLSAAPLTYAPGGDVDPSDVSGIVSWRNN